MFYRRSKVEGILLTLLFGAFMLANGFIWGRITAPEAKGPRCSPPVKQPILWSPKQQKLWIAYWRSQEK